MNLVLVEPEDFVDDRRIRLEGRRLDGLRGVLRAQAGDTIRMGLLNGRIGSARVARIDRVSADLEVGPLDREPPPPIPLRLILALPRPKVLNRTLAAAASLGIKQIDLINAWRVEKAYWSSDRLSHANIRLQLVLGLEQGIDTVLPTVRIHRLFSPFVRQELPAQVAAHERLVAHPGSGTACPRGIAGPAVLAVGPEGGFIAREVSTFLDVGFTAVTLGARILRVETALAHLVGRLF